jgi:hypothetical protein
MLYRLRQWFHYKRFQLATGILTSPPVTCEPDAPCAIHTVLGRKDLPLYVAAVKSFLRFYPAVAIVVHDDTTLRPQDRDALVSHVPGCQVIRAAEADERAREALGADSFLFGCRGWDVSYRRIIDTELWNAAPKRIILDSDILVLRRPQEVIEWIERSDRPFLMGQPPEPGPAAPDGAPKHIQTIFREKVGALSARLGLPDRFLQGTTGGFYGCSGGELALPKIERLLRTCAELGIPMRQWGGEQCVIIYLLSTADPLHLPPARYFNFAPDQLGKVGEATLIHFLGYCRFYQGLYANLTAAMVRSLKEPRPVLS